MALIDRENQQVRAKDSFAKDKYPGQDLTKDQWARLNNLDQLAGEINPKYLDINEPRQKAFLEQCKIEKD